MYFIIPILIVIIDQITKLWSVKFLQGFKTIEVVGDFLQFNYIRNYGAAFGFFQNKQLFFIIITSIIIIGIILFIKINNNSKIMDIVLLMIIGGAIGNLIDRIRLGYVIDFIDVKFGNFYDYPVFNIADSFIVVGSILLVYLVLTDKYEAN